MLQQQQQQQQVPNGIVRQSGSSIPALQNIPQIRNQVNISQQQRLPNNIGAANTRLSPQQMLQVQAQAAQAAQARALQVAQAQAAQNATATMNGIGPGMNNPHLSPPYNNRATTSSPMPHSSPSHPSATLSNASSSPRPPSAQSQGNMGPAQVPGNAMPRQAGNMGHFFSMPNVQNMQQNMQAMPGTNFTQEQIEHALRLQSLVQVSTLFR
jgi:chromatin modification-related protein VID21